MSFILGQNEENSHKFLAPKANSDYKYKNNLSNSWEEDLQGFFVQVFRRHNALDLINPFSTSTVSEEEIKSSVTWDPDNLEKPKGFILLGIRW